MAVGSAALCPVGSRGLFAEHALDDLLGEDFDLDRAAALLALAKGNSHTVPPP